MTSPAQRGSETEPSQLHRTASELGAALRLALLRLMAHFPEASERPMGLAKELGCQKDLSSRVHRALRKEDPLAALYHLPGPSALRDLIERIQRRKRALPGELAAARQAVLDFEDLVRTQAGDQSTFKGMISSRLPEAREKQELAGRQDMFRGIRALKGVAVKTLVYAEIATPCEHGDHVNLTGMQGFLGLRRFREDATVRIAARRFPGAPAEPGADSGFCTPSSSELDLSEFSSKSASVIVDRESGAEHGLTHLLLGQTGVGNRRTSSVFFGERGPCSLAASRFRAEEEKKASVSLIVSEPAEQLIFDVLVHKDLAPPSLPQSIVTEPAEFGPIPGGSPMVDLYRLPCSARVEESSIGIAGLRISSFERYLEVLNKLCEEARCEPADLRAFRMSVKYPIYSAQYHMTFV